MKKSRIIALIAAVVLVFCMIFFSESDYGGQLLEKMSLSGKWFMLLVVISALVDSINPCALSVLLITIAFLFSVGKDRKRIVQIGSSYIFGVFAVYLLIGLGVLKALAIFAMPHFASRVGAVIIIILSFLSLIGTVFPRFPIKLKIPSFAKGKIATLMEKTSLAAAFVLGVFVGLCEFPCTGGPYLMILGLLHDTSTYLTGFGYLIVYNIVFVLPLVLILLVSSDSGLVEKIDTWRKSENSNVKIWGSIIMIILGTFILLI